MNKKLAFILTVILCASTLSLVAINALAAIPTPVDGQITDNVAQAQLTSSWPMFHVGVTTSSGPSTNQTAWNFTAANGFWSSPAVADGKVYVGSYDHQVYALNATSGSLIWNYTTADLIDSSPAVSNGVIYIGSNDHNL